MASKVDPIEKVIFQNSIILKYIVTPQTVTSLENLVNKHT